MTNNILKDTIHKYKVLLSKCIIPYYIEIKNYNNKLSFERVLAGYEPVIVSAYRGDYNNPNYIKLMEIVYNYSRALLEFDKLNLSVSLIPKDDDSDDLKESYRSYGRLVIDKLIDADTKELEKEFDSLDSKTKKYINGKISSQSTIVIKNRQQYLFVYRILTSLAFLNNKEGIFTVILRHKGMDQMIQLPSINDKTREYLLLLTKLGMNNFITRIKSKGVN